MNAFLVHAYHASVMVFLLLCDLTRNENRCKKIIADLVRLLVVLFSLESIFIPFMNASYVLYVVSSAFNVKITVVFANEIDAISLSV